MHTKKKEIEMASTLPEEDKKGFIDWEMPYNERDKIEKAIARLWNDPDGKKENKSFNITKSSHKGFYDSSNEMVVIDKKRNKTYLCSAHTNFDGRSWRSPDYLSCLKIKKE